MMTSHSKGLSKILDIKFQNLDLLTAALTHRSYLAHEENNERLEFIGDSILNFIISEALYKKFPEKPEGQLSRYRSNLVCAESLTSIAKELNLADYIFKGAGEKNIRDSTLADTLEAVIGAIYWDAGFETCRIKVLLWFQSRLESLSPDVEGKDPKTLLQEYLQAQKKPVPTYEVIKIHGKAHDQRFEIECIADTNLKARAEGVSRRKAEQAAAAQILEKLKND